MGKHPHLRIDLTHRPEIVEAGLDYEVSERGKISTTRRPEYVDESYVAFVEPHTEPKQCGATDASDYFGGCLLRDLVGGALATSGAAFAVPSRSKIGEIAKSSGDAAARVGGKIVEINEKHRVADTLIDKTIEGFDWVLQGLHTKQYRS